MMHNIDVPQRTRSRITILDNSWSGLYGLAFLGALFYFLQQATTFWEGVIGVFKAIFWPGVLLYELLKYLRL
jgi:hypothetical protein